MGNEHAPRKEIVYNRVPKVSSDCVVVEVHREKAIRAKRFYRRREYARGDWLARARLSVLSRITEVRDDSGYLVCRSATRRINREKKPHPIFRRRRRRLYEEDVFTAEVFQKLHVLFAVGKDFAVDLSERHPKRPRDFLREPVIRPKTENAEVHMDSQYSRFGGPSENRTRASAMRMQRFTTELWALVRIENNENVHSNFLRTTGTYRSSRYGPVSLGRERIYHVFRAAENRTRATSTPCLRTTTIRQPGSGRRESNPVYTHPKRAYYRYTTARHCGHNSRSLPLARSRPHLAAAPAPCARDLAPAFSPPPLFLRRGNTHP